MIGWLMIFISGVLGSAHCVGMCGGFVVTLGSGVASLGANLPRQLIYSLGRVFTYVVCGAGVGYGGFRLASLLRPLADTQALLSIAAGMFLMTLGLSAAGVFPRSKAMSGTGNCLATTFFAAFLTRPGLTNIFLAGILNGLLPCGLVYAYLALAASSSDMLLGGVTMAVFGLGTLPVMILTGCGGSLLTLACRRHVFRVAAWCVVLTGALTLVRGLGFAHLPGVLDSPGCPMCQGPN